MATPKKQAVSAANAMHYAWQSAADPRTRALILHQAVGWMGQFKTYAETQKGTRRVDITAHPESEKTFTAAVERTRTVDGRRVYIAERLRHVIPKTNEVHFYKFPASLIEDIPLVSPEWRPHLAATMSYYTKNADDAETEAMRRARAV